MKTLTIKQPWATLICCGLKDVENRTWRTNFRGKILVHSSAKIDERHREMSKLFTPSQWNALDYDKQLQATHGSYPMSSIIGEVTIVDCITNSNSIWAEPNSWHLILKDPVMYDKPITGVKGALSIWDYKPQFYDGKFLRNESKK